MLDGGEMREIPTALVSVTGRAAPRRRFVDCILSLQTETPDEHRHPLIRSRGRCSPTRDG
eukprot:7107960-Prymnesium_polylepis.1